MSHSRGLACCRPCSGVSTSLSPSVCPTGSLGPAQNVQTLTAPVRTDCVSSAWPRCGLAMASMPAFSMGHEVGQQPQQLLRLVSVMWCHLVCLWLLALWWPHGRACQRLLSPGDRSNIFRAVGLPTWSVHFQPPVCFRALNYDHCADLFLLTFANCLVAEISE